MTVHGQEAPPKKTHFRYNKVDVWIEFQCFFYLHGPFSAALGPRARASSSTVEWAPTRRARSRTQGVTARSRHPDRVDNIAVPDAGIPTMVPGNAFQQLVNCKQAAA